MTDLLRSLRLFLALAETGNFSALARRQNISHSTVARAIDDLEAHFGVRLFRRTTRRLTLTRDGERLVDHAGRILDELDQAEAELAGVAAVRGLVRMGVTTALGFHYAARLALLHDWHPGLTIELIVADWRDMTDDSGLDLWLAIGTADRSRGVELGLLSRILVAAPAYLERHGAPAKAADLMDHVCLSYGYEARPSPWPIDGQDISPTGFLRANNSEAVQRAMLGGLGIALLPQIQIREALGSGAAVQILPGAAIAPLSIRANHAFQGAKPPLRVRTVLDFLIEHFPDDM